MQEVDKLKIQELLAELGFVKSGGNGRNIWRLQSEIGENTKDDENRRNVGHRFGPWRLREWSLRVRNPDDTSSSNSSANGRVDGAVVETQRIQIDLEFDALTRSIVAAARDVYGPRTNVHVRRALDGRLWCFLEFSKPATRDEVRGSSSSELPDGYPLGIAGFALQIAPQGHGRIAIWVTGRFALGWIPGEFVAAHSRFLRIAFGVGRGVSETDQSLSTSGDFQERESVATLALDTDATPEFDSPFGLQINLTDVVLDGLSRRLRAEEQSNRVDASQLRGLLETSARGHTPRLVSSDDRVTFEYPSQDALVERYRLAAAPPVEVLETNSQVAELTTVDRLLREGDVAGAGDSICRMFAGDVRSELARPLLRRAALCALALVQRKGSAARLAETLESAEKFGLENDALVLSALLRVAVSRREWDVALEYASGLTASVGAEIPDFNDTPAFDVVLPELLGDLWLAAGESNASDQATQCWLRILERRGEIPRVLRKLMTLAQHNGDLTAEAQWIRRLCTVERRRKDLGILNLRLAAIGVESSAAPGVVLNDALRALELGPALYEAALIAARALGDLSRAREAIELLETFVRDQWNELPVHARARLECLSGILWAKELRRPDMARARFESVLRLSPDFHEVEGYLEDVLKEMGATDELERHYRARLQRLEQSGTSQQIREALDAFLVWVKRTGQPASHAELLAKFAGRTVLLTDEIDLLVSSRGAKVDWPGLYANLRGQLVAGTVTSEQGRLHLQMARIARDFLRDNVLVGEHLNGAMQVSELDDAAFAILEQELFRLGWVNQLVDLYERRFSTAQGRARSDAAFQLIALADESVGPAKDRVAATAFGALEDGETILLRRMRQHVQRDDPESMASLFRAAVFGPMDGNQGPDGAKLRVPQHSAENLARNTLELLSECIDPARFEFMASVLETLDKQSGDPASVERLALELLRDTPVHAHLVPWLTRTLNRGRLPERYDIRFLTQVLSGDGTLLARWYELSAAEAPSPEEGAAFLRTAVALLAGNAANSAAVESLLVRLCTTVPCGDRDMEQLESMVERTGNWALYAKALDRQCDFEDEPRRRTRLLQTLADVYRKRVGDVGGALNALARADGAAEHPWEVQLQVASLGVETGRHEEARTALISAARHALSVGDVSAIGKCFSIATQFRQGTLWLREFARDAYQKQQIPMDSTLRRAIAVELVRIGAKIPEVVLEAFEWYCEHDTASATRIWGSVLQSFASATRTRRWIEETTAIASRSSRAEIVFDALRLVVKDEQTKKLHKRTRKELLLTYGLQLFDRDDKRKKALRYLEEAWLLDKAESRIWIPLYLLVQEFGTTEQRIESLKELLPRLERDPGPIGNLPITIESLRAELQALEYGNAPSGGLRNGGGRGRQAEAFMLKADGIELVDPALVPDFREAEADQRNVALDMAAGAEYQRMELKIDEAAEETPIALAPVEQQLEYRTSEVATPQLLFDADLLPGVDALAPPPTMPPEIPPVPAPPAQESMEFRLDMGAELPLAGSSEASMDLGVSMDVVSQDAAADSVDVKHFPELHLAERGLNQPEATGMVELGIGVLGSSDPSEDPVSATASDGVERFRISDVSVDLPTPMSSDQVLSLDARAFETGEASPPPLPPLPPPPPPPPSLRSVPTAPDSESPVEFSLGSTGDESVVAFSLDAPELPPVDASPSFSLEDENSAPEVSLPPTPIESGASAQSMDSGSQDPMGVGSILQTPSGQSEVGNAALDWRNLVLSGNVGPKHVDQVLGQAFASELEKHVAVQCVAILSGEVHKLSGWHWRVWRDSKEFGYPLSGRDRFPDGGTPRGIGGPLHKLVTSLVPMLVKAYPEHYSLERVAERVQVPLVQVEKLRRPLKWDAGMLAVAGLGLYRKRLVSHRYTAFSVPGLGAKLFYDGRNRALHLDEEWWQGRPPSQLFHKILGTLWSVKLNYFVLLELDPIRDVMPIVNDLRSTWDPSTVAKVKLAFGMARNRVSRLLDTVDQNQVRPLLDKIGVPQYDAMVRVWDAMHQHLFRLLLAETLDMVGLFEMLTDRDLTSQGVLKPGEILQLSPHAGALIEFATRLRFRE